MGLLVCLKSVLNSSNLLFTWLNNNSFWGDRFNIKVVNLFSVSFVEVS